MLIKAANDRKDRNQENSQLWESIEVSGQGQTNQKPNWEILKMRETQRACVGFPRRPDGT